MSQVMLGEYLADYANPLGKTAEELASVILALAASAIEVRGVINQGALASGFADVTAGHNADGDAQKALDVRADEIFLFGLKGSPIAVYASEEQDAPVILDDTKPLALAIDPLDGSSNIDTNVSIGTIFTVLPVGDTLGADPLRPFMQAGNCQLCAGFFVYGPQLSLVLTLGAGVQIFVYSEQVDGFVLAYENVKIARDAREFAVNASNQRHWHAGFKHYIDDCLAGVDGPFGKNYNMRWIASLVADTYRILIRGGVFYYPSDKRFGYDQGRLRLVYEANPIAFLVEQADGAATDCKARILDITPEDLHQRVPLAFGARDEIARAVDYCAGAHNVGNKA